jgi:hypothetical protein
MQGAAASNPYQTGGPESITHKGESGFLLSAKALSQTTYMLLERWHAVCTSTVKEQTHLTIPIETM